MQRTSICYVITKSNFGGAQKYVFELATALPKEHFDVTVALGGNGPLAQKLTDAGITTITIPHLERDVSVGKELKVFLFLYRFFKKEGFDVVHLNSSKIGGLGGLAARLTGVPRIIFTAHGFAFNEQRSSASKLLIKISYWVTMLLADTTIAVSQAIKEQVHGWPFLYRRLTVIHNGIRTFPLRTRDDARVQLASRFPNLDQQKQWVGTLAELHPIKGLDVYIESIAQLGDIANGYQFVIMGEGEERKKLEQQIEQHKLTNTVVLLGYVDAAPQFLQAFDAFVLPSRSEALALAVLEAGFAKLPTIASNVGGIPEVIIDKKSGLLVPPDDVQALTGALTHMLTHHQDAVQYGISLHNRVIDTFSHQRMLEQTTQHYTS